MIINTLKSNGNVKITVNALGEGDDEDRNKIHSYGMILYKNAVWKMQQNIDKDDCILKKICLASALEIKDGDEINVEITFKKLTMSIHDAGGVDVKHAMTFKIANGKYRLHVVLCDSRQSISMKSFLQIA